MDWIKKHYDKVILALAALACAACAVMAYMKFSALEADFSMAKFEDQKHEIPEPPMEVLARAIVLVKDPVQWRPHSGSLLVSRLYLRKGDQLIDPIESEDPIHPPIPNKWFIEHNIDYTDPDILNKDLHGNGFTVIEIWRAGLNPNDPRATPPLTTKLFLQSFISTPFLIKFTGSPDDGETFMINAQGIKRTQFLKIGDMIEAGKDADGKPQEPVYKLIKFTPKTTVKNDIEVDVSELIIENTKTNRRITLVTNVDGNDPSSEAEFFYKINNSTFKVKIDEEFHLPPDTETRYKLISVSETEATILNIKTQQEIKIPKMQQ